MAEQAAPGLTKTGTELQRVRTKVIELERELATDLAMLEQILWGDHDAFDDDEEEEVLPDAG